MKPRLLKSVDFLLLMLFFSITASPSANGVTVSTTNPTTFATELTNRGIVTTTIDFEGIAEAGEDPYILDGSEFFDCYGVEDIYGETAGYPTTITAIPSVGISGYFWDQFTPFSGVAFLSPNITENPIGVITVVFSEPVKAIGAYFLDSDRVTSNLSPTSSILAAGANVPVTGTTTVEPKFVGIIDDDGFTTATFYIGYRYDGSSWRSDPEGGTAIDDLIFEQIVTVPPVHEVEIDIKPGSYPNTINLGSNGVVPVAILSSEEFDATTIDPDTVTLEGSGVAIRGNGKKYLAHEEDVNDDGLMDLVCQIETENLDENLQSGSAILTINTGSCWNIEGIDEITIVPPE